MALLVSSPLLVPKRTSHLYAPSVQYSFRTEKDALCVFVELSEWMSE